MKNSKGKPKAGLGKPCPTKSQPPVQQGFSDGVASEFVVQTRGRALQSMDRLTQLAVLVFSADHAKVYLTQGGVTRLIAASSPSIPYRSRSWDFSEAPYGRHDTVVIEDGRNNTKLQQLPALLGMHQPISFFFRTPVKIADGYCLALIIYSAAAQPRPPEGDFRLIEQIVVRLGEEFATISAALTGTQQRGAAAVELPSLMTEVATADRPTMLLDAKLKVKAVSQSAAALLGHSVENLLRSSHYEAAPAATDALTFYYRRALATGLSTPDMEIFIHPPGSNNPPKIYSVLASPIVPAACKATYLYKTFTELTELISRHDALAETIARRSGTDMASVEPSADFLFETLIPRRAIRARNGSNYVTLRCWRQPIRSYQIQALKALKATASQSFAQRIADEIADEITSLVGVDGFNAIVPIPCGHSKGPFCLSVSIARELGKRLNLPVVQAFARQKNSGSSHPRQNIDKAPPILQNDVFGSVILIDDVATSGHHLAEAAQLLKANCKTVFSIAWIGGDAADDDTCE